MELKCSAPITDDAKLTPEVRQRVEERRRRQRQQRRRRRNSRTDADARMRSRASEEDARRALRSGPFESADCVLRLFSQQLGGAQGRLRTRYL